MLWDDKKISVIPLSVVFAEGDFKLGPCIQGKCTKNQGPRERLDGLEMNSPIAAMQTHKYTLLYATDVLSKSNYILKALGR